MPPRSPPAPRPSSISAPPAARRRRACSRRSPPSWTASPAAAPATPAPAVPQGAPGTSRDNPALVTLVSRHRLNKGASEKETWHVEFDLAAAGLDYTVGDSFGIFPENDPTLVAAVLAAIGADGSEEIEGRPVTDILARDVSLGAAPDGLFQLLTYLTGGEARRRARALAAGEDPDGDAAGLDVLAALEKFGRPAIAAEVLVEALEPLQPRLYSISSSPKATPGRLSLTVDTVRYRLGSRTRLGVGSTFLSGRLEPGAPMRAYVQKAHGFALPADPRRRSSWSGRAPASRRSAPSCGSGWRAAPRAATGCSSAISAAIATSSTRTSFPACVPAATSRA